MVLLFSSFLLQFSSNRGVVWGKNSLKSIFFIEFLRFFLHFFPLFHFSHFATEMILDVSWYSASFCTFEESWEHFLIPIPIPYLCYQFIECICGVPETPCKRHVNIGPLQNTNT